MSKMSDFDVFSLLNVRNVKLDLMVNEKTSKVKREICAEKNASKLLYGPPPPPQKKHAILYKRFCIFVKQWYCTLQILSEYCTPCDGMGVTATGVTFSLL